MLSFTIPWTTIPRTNSMIYQSHWMEAIFPALTFKFLLSGVHLSNIRIWTEEPELMSIRVFLKTYLMDVVPFTVMYVSCYWIWSVYLEFNHPLPNLGLLLFPTRNFIRLRSDVSVKERDISDISFSTKMRHANVKKCQKQTSLVLNMYPLT